MYSCSVALSNLFSLQAINMYVAIIFTMLVVLATEVLRPLLLL
jgi:hypothetical protein